MLSPKATQLITVTAHGIMMHTTYSQEQIVGKRMCMYGKKGVRVFLSV